MSKRKVSKKAQAITSKPLLKAVAKLAENIFFEKIAEYNVQEPEQHNSRVIVLDEDFAMLIYWSKKWTYTIHRLEQR